MTRLLRILPFSIGLTVPIAGIVLARRPDGVALVFLPLFIFGVIPLLDLLIGRERRPLAPESAATRARSFRYDLWLWAWIPLQLIALGLAVKSVDDGGLPWSSFVLLALSTGLVTGLGINVAHELMHRRGKVERALAELLMTTTSYTHFCVEHVHGHHKHVATPNDPASSKKGESVYAYLPRTLIGGLRSAWRIETARVKARGLARISLRDRRLRYPLILAVVYGAAVVVAGPWGAVFFALQSAVAITLLEVINFIEHYGLARQELAPGRYERCLPAHSWNASERLTNWFLFHLQRHADHHHLASRPYFVLRHIDDSPQMPTGYAGMVLLALVPPLWRRVMDPRVDAWTQQQQQHDPSSSSSSSSSSAPAVSV